MLQHGVTQLHSYAVSFTVGEVSFSNGYLYYIIYIIYYIYNIKYFFLPKATAQLHLMQLRNCVTVYLRCVNFGWELFLDEPSDQGRAEACNDAKEGEVTLDVFTPMVLPQAEAKDVLASLW